MARKFQSGKSSGGPSADIRSYISQALGTDAVPAEETSSRVAKPDYNGLDFTGLKGGDRRRLKQTVQSPEYRAQVKAGKQRMRRYTDPFTEEQIASDPAKQAIKSGITYEQALAAYRKQVKYMNMMKLEGKGSNAKAIRFYESMTPIQRNAQRILGLLGGFGKDYGGRTAEQTYRERIFGQLGMDISQVPNYSPVKETYTTSKKFGTIIKVDNPLNATQRGRLQRLRGMVPSSLTKRQQAALARLRALKNAPTILSGEE